MIHKWTNGKFALDGLSKLDKGDNRLEALQAEFDEPLRISSIRFPESDSKGMFAVQWKSSHDHKWHLATEKHDQKHAKVSMWLNYLTLLFLIYIILAFTRYGMLQITMQIFLILTPRFSLTKMRQICLGIHLSRPSGSIPSHGMEANQKCPSQCSITVQVDDSDR